MQLALANGAVAQNPYPNFQVVLDPGHGGLNPGVVWRGDTTLVESEVTCALVSLVDEKLLKRGIAVSWTTDKTCTFFASDRRIITGTVEGLDERVNYIREVSRPSTMRTFVVSIHVDSAWKEALKGAYVIVPKGRTSSLLAKNIAKEFADLDLDQKLCRKRKASIVAIGTCKIKAVRILERAPVEEMVLVEVANIGNTDERLRLTSAFGLELYSNMITSGILKTLESYAEK